MQRLFIFGVNEATIILPIASVFVLLIGVVGIWIYYAYTHPNTRSGKFLIEVICIVKKQKRFTYYSE
jgi:hypothetical protein